MGAKVSIQPIGVFGPARLPTGSTGERADRATSRNFRSVALAAGRRAANDQMRAVLRANAHQRVMRDTSTIEIDLTAIDANMATLRRAVGSTCRLCPIVKADAYGLGAPRIARRLAQAGADMLAVYSPEQAASVLRAAPGVPVLVLMPVREIGRTDELARALVAGQLHLALHDDDHLDALVSIGQRLGAVVPAHLEIDSGLGRGGALPYEALRILKRLATTPWVRLAGVMTHFSSARDDEPTAAAQMKVFDDLLADAVAGGALPPDMDGITLHVASTYALLRHRRFHRSMVRFGLAWAGYGIDELDDGAAIVGAAALRPAVTWSSCLVQLKRLPVGAPVGYGSRFVTARPTLIGLVPIGYADGFPRTTTDSLAEVPGTAPMIAVAIPETDGSTRRAYVPVVGAVNMDQISVDLTGLLPNPPQDSETLDRLQLPSGLGVGTRVELISADPLAPNHLPRLAAAAGTIPHEMLSRLHPGIRRLHLCEPLRIAAPSERPVAVAG